MPSMRTRYFPCAFHTESIKLKVEGDPWAESKLKAEAETDTEFVLKSGQWIKMEWTPPTDSKFMDQQMKPVVCKEEEADDLWDSVAKLETLDPGLYKVISADILRLHAENNMLGEELACKEKDLTRKEEELAQKDDLIASKDDLIATQYKLINELQQQIHTLRTGNGIPEEQVFDQSKEDLENSKGPLNFHLNIPTTVRAMDGSMHSSYREEQKLTQTLERFTEGI